MDDLRRDVRHAFRTLRKNPGFSTVVVLTLGLGIGANTAIFSLLDQVLLRALPVKDPTALVQLDGPGPFQGRTFNDATFSYPIYVDFRDRNQVFEGVLARFPTSMTLSHGGQSERVEGELVSGNYFDVLGLRPALGRAFSAADDRTPGAHPVAILTHGFWQRRFGGNPDILNQTVGLNGHPMTIAGVAPAGFHGIQVGSEPDVFVPLMMKAQMTPTWNDLDNRRSRWLTIMARLEPGMSVQQAETGMNVLYRQINEQEIKDIKGPGESFRKRFVAKHLKLLPGAKGLSDIRQRASTPLIVLMCMVGLVLLIACANVANLLLARATSRQKEVAIRLALGAGRLRIVREQFVESVVLALVGGGVGLLFAAWTGSLILGILPANAGGQTLSSDPDLRVMVFALGASILTAVIFGLVPALQAARPAVTTALKEESGGVAGGGHQAKIRKGLVVVQVSLSMLLLAGAGLFARSLHNLKTLDPGFRAENLLGFSVDPSLSGYDQQRIRSLFQRIQEEIAGVPGVRAASMAEIGALTGNAWSSTVKIDGYKPKEDENMNPLINGVGPGYFATMGLPLVAGREFSEKDILGAPRVAVINQTMAKYYYGAGNPIGRLFGFGRDSDATAIEIVGVVKDTRSTTLRDEIERFVYIPCLQNDELSQITYYVRTTADPASTATALRQVAQRIDPNLPIYDLKTMEAQIDDSLFVERMVAVLSSAFGLLATVLAAIGLYGVMSYAVARRTREIGIRMALGAERASVLWLVLREVAIMGVVGIVVGLAVAAGLTRFVQGQLFGLSATDPLTLMMATSVLAAVALLAGYVPARRATAVDPLLALRYE